MSEEKPSADSDLTSAATATGSDAESMSVPRQSLGPAVESDGTAEPVEAEAPVEAVVPEAAVPVEAEAPAEPPWAWEPAATAEPVTVPWAKDEPASAEAPVAEPVPAAEPTPPAALAAAESPAVPTTPVPTPVVPAPRKSKRGVLTGAVFGLIVLVLLAAIGVLVYLRLYADPTKNAAAGNCLADLPVVAVGEDKEVTRVRVVDCADAAATHVVEGRIDNRTEAEAKSAEACKAYPDSTFIYRAVPPGGTGYVLCLKELAN